MPDRLLGDELVAIVVGLVGPDDPELRIQHEQRLAYRAQKLRGVFPHIPRHRRGPFPHVDVHERHDGPADVVIERLVGADPQLVPALIPAGDLFLHVRERLDHLAHLETHVAAAEGVQVPDGTSQIDRKEVEEALRRRRVTADPQIHSHDDDRVVQADQHVVEVVVGLAELHHAVLELLVDGGELLVGGLHLLARGLQLFVRALKLLVRGLKLFVRRLQLLVGAFLVLDRRLQIFP